MSHNVRSDFLIKFHFFQKVACVDTHTDAAGMNVGKSTWKLWESIKQLRKHLLKKRNAKTWLIINLLAIKLANHRDKWIVIGGLLIGWFCDWLTSSSKFSWHILEWTRSVHLLYFGPQLILNTCSTAIINVSHATHQKCKKKKCKKRTNVLHIESQWRRRKMIESVLHCRLTNRRFPLSSAVLLSLPTTRSFWQDRSWSLMTGVIRSQPQPHASQPWNAFTAKICGLSGLIMTWASVWWCQRPRVRGYQMPLLSCDRLFVRRSVPTHARSLSAPSGC